MTHLEEDVLLTATAGLKIKVDRWPESTENPVGPPMREVWKSGCLPTNVGFFVAFAVSVNATNNVSYSNLIK